MKLLSKDHDLGFLVSNFERIDFHLFVSDDPISFISCFACLCDSSRDIIENWQAIQNFVSGYYQPVGGLASWNIYLAFFTKERMPLWEKYEIENNKYAARKLVIDCNHALPGKAQMVDDLSTHLLGSDLLLEHYPAEPREALLSLEDYVRGAPLDSKAESREERARMIINIMELLEKKRKSKKLK